MLRGYCDCWDVARTLSLLGYYRDTVTVDKLRGCASYTSSTVDLSLLHDMLIER